jgi:hypothetical protein
MSENNQRLFRHNVSPKIYCIVSADFVSKANNALAEFSKVETAKWSEQPSK